MKVRKRNKTILSFLSKLAPTATALIALIALVYGIYNVDKTIEKDKQLKAIDVYYDYTLRIEAESEKGNNYLDTTFTFNPTNWENKNYQLFAHYVLFISETIYSLVSDNDAWCKTIYKYMLYPHVAYYENKRLIDDALLPEFRKFYEDSVKFYFKNKSLEFNLLNIPDVRQSKSYTCGASAAQAILMYYGIDDSEDRIVEKFGTTDNSGTSPIQIIKGFKEYGLEATIKENSTFQDLINNIKNGIPTMVAIQAWSDSNIPLDWKNNWEDGHWVIVVGMDYQRIYFEDPSILGSKGWLMHNEFLERWHDYVGEVPCCDSKDKLYEKLSISIKGSPQKLNNLIHID